MIAIKLIKKLLTEEITEKRNVAYQAVVDKFVSDSVKSIVWDAFQDKLKKIPSLNSREEIDDFLSECGYRMSLEDWEVYYEKEEND